MMDSQEKTLEMGNQEEMNKVESTPVTAAEPATEGETPQVATEETEAEAAAEPEYKKHYATKKEVLDRVREIAHNEEAPAKDEVDYLKTVFYKLHIAEREANLKSYIDAGGDPESYLIAPDED